MSTASNIEWTDATWNPVAGCTPVSPGCLNCYAATMARRLEAMGRPEYVGLTVQRGLVMRDLKAMGEAEVCRVQQPTRTMFNGTVRCLEERLAEPLRWRKPRRVFVNSMSDLFHEDVPFGFIDRVFAVMALCPRHTFQVLTKRPERMAGYLDGLTDPERLRLIMNRSVDGGEHRPGAYNLTSIAHRSRGSVLGRTQFVPPFRNVWLGTSVEDQARADKRIPHLLECPAAVRFLSCEPLLGPVDLSAFFGGAYAGLPGDVVHPSHNFGIGWVIVGGESGPQARPCDVAWVRLVVRQCAASGVPCFVKQLGAHVTCRNDEVAVWLDGCGLGLDWIETDRVGMQGDPVRVLLSGKGGDPAEWPEDLRVREFPVHSNTGDEHAGMPGNRRSENPAG